MNGNEIEIREEVIQAFLEKLDCILAMKLIKVKSDNRACTDGRVIYLPLEYYKKEAKDMKDYILMIKGLNYHELGHVFFTTFTSMQIKKFCTQNKLEQTQFFDILNMLEDMRVENYMVRVYPKSKPYLTYINTVIMRRALRNGMLLYDNDWMANLWLPQIGKVYLPKEFRLDLMRKTNTFDSNTTKEIIQIVNKYINLARDYGEKLRHKKYKKEYETKLLYIAKRLYDILIQNSDNNNVAMPIFAPNQTSDTAKEYRDDDNDEKLMQVLDVESDVSESDVSIDDVDEREGEEERKEEEERNDKEEGGEGERKEEEEKEEEERKEEEEKAREEEKEEEERKEEEEKAREEEKEEEEGEGGRNEEEKGGEDGKEESNMLEKLNELREIVDELEKIKEEVKENVREELQQDYKVILDIDKEILTEEEEKAKEEIEKLLKEVVNEYKAHWVIREKEGRINIRHAMKSERNGDTRIFKKFKPNKMNELEFRIFLNVDTSGSMWNKIMKVRSIAKVILRAFEITESKLKVVGFNDRAILYKEWEEKHIPYLSANGNTNAHLTFMNIFMEAREIQKKYRKPIIIITITDGDWNYVDEAEEIIRELKKMGVITVEINIDVEKYHGSEFCYYIKSVSELPNAIRDFTERLAVKLIKNRQYLL